MYLESTDGDHTAMEIGVFVPVIVVDVGHCVWQTHLHPRGRPVLDVPRAVNHRVIRSVRRRPQHVPLMLTLHALSPEAKGRGWKETQFVD